tara:strand:+ start:1054 stop:1311 length:258 start_codon:yes stop_codon:yes gene_type:complete
MNKFVFLNIFILSLIIYELFSEYYRVTLMKDKQYINSYFEALDKLENCKNIDKNDCYFEKVLLNNKKIEMDTFIYNQSKAGVNFE